MSARTRRLSMVCSRLRQPLRCLTASAVSLLLLLTLMILVEGNWGHALGALVKSVLAAGEQQTPPIFDPAQATIPPPFLPVQLEAIPALPANNSPITIRAFGMWHDACVPRYQTHQIIGNVITIAAVANPPMVVCGQVITPWSFSVAIDPLSAGNYRVDLLITRSGVAARYQSIALTVTSPPAAQLITATGGEVTHHDNGQRTTLVVPSGAVTTPNVFAISYQPAPTITTSLHPVGHFVAITAAPANFAKPFTLTLRYSDTVRGPTIPGTATLYRLSSGQWVTDGITVTTQLTDGLTAQISQLSLYGLLGQTNRFYLPILR